MFEFFVWGRRRLTIEEKIAQGEAINSASAGFGNWLLGLFGIIGKTAAQQRREDEEVAWMLGEDPDVRRRRLERGDGE